MKPLRSALQDFDHSKSITTLLIVHHYTFIRVSCLTTYQKIETNQFFKNVSSNVQNLGGTLDTTSPIYFPYAIRTLSDKETTESHG